MLSAVGGRLAAVASVIALGLNAVCAQPQESLQSEISARCAVLQNADFSAILDAPTQVTQVTPVDATDEVPAHCKVNGYVTPQVGIEIKLPTESWNGKFLMMGCGGWCGVLSSSYTRRPGHACDQGLRKAYACITTDQGHQSTILDVKWAYNNLQAQVDYAFRATHVATVAGKAIVERYYGKAPSKSYFWGCSGGGRQGLVAAQKFPWDFDGVVVVAPGGVDALWNTRVATAGGQALFSRADVIWLHQTVIAQCDRDDGVVDGVIGNPPACKIDPSEWLCTARNSTHCLSEEQAKAFRKIYEGPTNSRGEVLAAGFGPGMELGIPFRPELSSLHLDFFRYMAFNPAPGPGWRAEDFDFDRDYPRLAFVRALLAADNPDLRKFKAAGGKLIVAHGWADPVSSPFDKIDYYRTVERTMGGRAATQDFFRLFMVPGMDHCTEGDGAYAIDYLSYLDDWAEKSQAPDVMIGAHIKEGYTGWDFELPADPANIAFTRPVYPYPLWAKYTGKGDPNDAGNFRPARQ